ncbi:MAG TPA: ABC transporter ATP-binding protein [Bacteroidota bacterium]|nr:ABC transporter ATP-binding protein [Bacteroidota bacterium]
MQNTPEIQIALSHVTKRYDTASGSFRALDDISLSIRAGQLVAVTGKSGSGKSTLLNIITGIDTLSEGSVTIAGRTMNDLSEDALAAWRGRTIGIVFQFFQLLPTLTIAENVMLPMDFCSTTPRRARRARTLELLKQVGIEEQADKLPSALSGGQQQRAAIARALANDPPIIVADEPTGNLDSHTAQSIFQLFKDLAARGKTVVIVTHEKEFTSLFKDSVTICDGTIVDSSGVLLQ